MSWRVDLAPALILASCSPSPFREVELSETRASSEAGAATTRTAQELRFSIAAMQSPGDSYVHYVTLFKQAARDAGVVASFTRRRTYGEVNDLLLGGKLDVALICTGGYLDMARRSPGATEVVAVPVVRGRTTYSSVVIVPHNSPARVLGDLEGRRFAFTDSLSLSGRAYVEHRLGTLGRTAQRFYSSVVFTQSHDRSIDAVANGFVDGASVDSLILEHRIAREPSLSGRVRILETSPPFGIMPVVARTGLSAEVRADMRRSILRLHANPAAQQALATVGIDKFVPPPHDLYDEAMEVFSNDQGEP